MADSHVLLRGSKEATMEMKQVFPKKSPLCGGIQARRQVSLLREGAIQRREEPNVRKRREPLGDVRTCYPGKFLKLV